MGRRWGVICAELGKVEGGVVGTKKNAYLCALIDLGLCAGCHRVGQERNIDYDRSVTGIVQECNRLQQERNIDYDRSVTGIRQ